MLLVCSRLSNGSTCLVKDGFASQNKREGGLLFSTGLEIVIGSFNAFR